MSQTPESDKAWAAFLATDGTGADAANLSDTMANAESALRSELEEAKQSKDVFENWWQEARSDLMMTRGQLTEAKRERDQTAMENERVKKERTDAMSALDNASAERDRALADLAQAREELKGIKCERNKPCTHCGERHSSHVGCRSDWSGIDACGR